MGESAQEPKGSRQCSVAERRGAPARGVAQRRGELTRSQKSRARTIGAGGRISGMSLLRHDGNLVTVQRAASGREDRTNERNKQLAAERIIETEREASKRAIETRHAPCQSTAHASYKPDDAKAMRRTQ